jgi:diguanylate cyclase (GGDEF)-like protein
MSAIMIDIDHFKTFNDNHGHLMGDRVLQSVADLLERSIRKADLLARFGGEEFVILLPEIDKERGRKVAEKLRRAVERAEFPKEETQPLGKITISLGLASFPEDSSRAPDLLDRADRALYTAKTLGRNQAAVAQPANDDSKARRAPALATAAK